MNRFDPHDLGLEKGLLRGITVFRSVACVWAVVGLAVSTGDLTRPAVAWSLVGVIAVATAFFGRLDLRHPSTAVSGAAIGSELIVGAVLLVGDGLVFEAFRQQSLPWAWPAAAVMTAGVAYGQRIGLGAAIWVAAASVIGEGMLRGGTDWGVAAGSKIGLFLLVGVVAGYVADQLRLADRTMAEANARDNVARTLHDGVLQTLAVIQRRSPETELVKMARSQEVELRTFLAGPSPIDAGPIALESELRDRASKIETTRGVPIGVVVAPDIPELSSATVAALVGAGGEAMINAAKHAEATQITVYAEPSDGGGAYLSVSDNGKGFDIDTAEMGMGITGSIQGRMDQIGGRSKITSRRNAGTEVELWAP